MTARAHNVIEFPSTAAATLSGASPHRAPPTLSLPRIPLWWAVHAFTLPLGGALLGAFWGAIFTAPFGLRWWAVIACAAIGSTVGSLMRMA